MRFFAIVSLVFAVPAALAHPVALASPSVFRIILKTHFTQGELLGPNDDFSAGRFGGLESICADGICEPATSTIA